MQQLPSWMTAETFPAATLAGKRWGFRGRDAIAGGETFWDLMCQVQPYTMSRRRRLCQVMAD